MLGSLFDQTRKLQARRRYGTAVLLACGVAGGGGFLIAGGQDGLSANPSGRRVALPPKESQPGASRVVHLGPGQAQAAARLPEPDGVILLARVIAPRDAHVAVELTVSNVAGPVAGIRFVNMPSKRDPSLSCRSQGDMQVCDQAEEWCPMPAGNWRLRVTKATGPAADVRVDFVVGPKPRSNETPA
jgi:hypothetical protein